MNRSSKKIIILILSLAFIIFAIYASLFDVSFIPRFLSKQLADISQALNHSNDETGESTISDHSIQFEQEGSQETTDGFSNTALSEDESFSPISTHSTPSENTSFHQPTLVLGSNHSEPDESRQIEPTTSPLSAAERSIGQYKNHEIELIFPSGGRLTMGVDTDDRSALYLDPHYECASGEITSADMRIGYYLSYVYPDYDLHTSETQMCSMATVTNETHFYISDRTFDTLLPSSYYSPDDYGICWVDEDNWNGQEPTRDKKIGIRIVRLNDGCLLGMAELHIIYNEETQEYSMTSLRNSEVSFTGMVSKETRQALIKQALSFFTETDYDELMQLPSMENSDETSEIPSYHAIGIQYPVGTDWRMVTCFVEIPDQAYFTKLYSPDFQPIRSASVQHKTIYAVTVNSPVSAYATFYFSPRIELAGGTTKNKEEDLVLWGIDVYEPFSRESVLIRESEREFFFDAD